MTLICTKRRRIFFAAAASLTLSLSAAHAKNDGKQDSPAFTQAMVYTTARDTGERLHAGGPLKFEDLPQSDEWTPCILLDPTRRFQTIVGFGGALTDSSAETFYKLPADKQAEILSAYFSVDKGIGYSLGRTNINSCDFSSDTYSCDDVAGDVKLAHFSIDHDLKYKIPFIKVAMAATNGQLKMFASPWSPPAWMKTNNDMSHGGALRPEDRQPWADFYVRFVDAYRKADVPMWGLTVQNEEMAVQSWESCIYTAKEEHEFVRDYLGPTLKKNKMSDVKLMVWDHNRGLMYQRVQDMLSDPKTAPYIWGTAYHWYTGDHFENPGVVHDAFPDKAVLFTEGTLNYYNTGQYTDWSIGEHYAQNELSDLNQWSAGWTDWNILLDERGGPNHVNNFCCAPIMADTKTGELHYLSSYYYLGHFSKFIRPGAQRIACSSTEDGLVATAFVNPDNSVATVVLNLTDKPRDYKVWIAGKAVSTHSPAHSIETVVLK
ncbi:glycosyl hydrolase [Capsulimonas corticalis]|uniref:Glycosyl hydrolase n=1 Tax=Capsulimonas corticalis TaxID=2219043 RepID=A0A402D6B4_9BACT|nr:glycoside hydrolase family 30 protein [Capsulimonas corticalis]BDI32046.1 glycosyl hydrolase [Capsulimonas corticalis]